MKLIILLAFVFGLGLSAADDLIIQLPDGKVQGRTFTTQNNKTYYGFQGIPFASPPIGNLRFEAPRPPKPWDGVWDATSEKTICMQFGSWAKPNDQESEDCLYINVYTPSLKSTEKLPVMFWIHGGVFVGGSSLKAGTGPDFLIEKDVVLVSFNYRVGPLGFLSTGDLAIQGNAGLKDQHLALKWTHQNIELFGGDPKLITIFGQSAGGMSIAYHLVSRKSEGLFRGAILQSGSALIPTAVDDDPKKNAFILADKLSGGSYKNNTLQLKAFLQEKSAKEIKKAIVALNYPLDWPVIETISEDAFLTNSPYESLASGNFTQVPIMVGITAEESLGAFDGIGKVRLDALNYDLSPKKLIPTDLHPNVSDRKTVIKKIKSIYLQKGKLFSTNLLALIKYESDNNLNRGVIKHAELSSKYVPVYLYKFAYAGRSISVVPQIKGAGKVSHSAELPFLFNIEGAFTTHPDDLRTQNIMVELWTNFAKYLNPTPKSTTEINLQWPLISPNNMQYLNINNTPEILQNIRGKSFSDWNNIYDTYGKKPFVTF